KSAQIREILISESAWEEMTCLFAPSIIYACKKGFIFITDYFFRIIVCNMDRYKNNARAALPKLGAKCRKNHIR
ncbi:hypothetical protein KQE47_25440, partial [Raoultella planticola]|nr:hypothetical protein [Raoultella planticola]MDC3911706.1 hypothetical protein [Raoultella planticola]